MSYPDIIEFKWQHFSYSLSRPTRFQWYALLDDWYRLHTTVPDQNWPGNKGYRMVIPHSLRGAASPVSCSLTLCSQWKISNINTHKNLISWRIFGDKWKKKCLRILLRGLEKVVAIISKFWNLEDFYQLYYYHTEDWHVGFICLSFYHLAYSILSLRFSFY